MKEHRETRQRQAILDMLRETYEHPTADAVYEAVKLSVPSISKGTVYRNLKVLRDMGKVTELKLDDTVSRYDYRRDPHPHFRCDRCNRVLDMDTSVDAGLDRRAAETTGLQIYSHELEFHGLCRECQKITGENKEV